MPDDTRPVRRAAFTSILAATMAVATFAGVVFGPLARFIIDDLSLSKAQLGLVVTAFSIVGALFSPLIGRATDRIGGRRAMIGVFTVGGLSLIAISGAQSLVWLILAAATAGCAQAAANPSTNKLISVNLPIGTRGAVTGVKQSGVQLGVFLAGVLLPSGALAWGWRTAVLVCGVVALSMVFIVNLIVPPDPAPAVSTHTDRVKVASPRIVVLALYGGLMGVAAGSMTTYLPLYGEEVIGLSVAVAGAVLGFGGLVAIVSRIIWARHAEKTGRYVRTLRSVAGIAVIFVASLLIAPTGGPIFLWIGALGFFATSNSWNSVGMLAVMVFAGSERAGGASGVVLFGFFSGLALGPPLFGWSVDHYGSYSVGWSGVLVVLVLASVLAGMWDRSGYRDMAGVS